MGFIWGKNRTSWIEVLLVINITNLSIPIPIPDVGGIPYSKDLMKSISINIASSSPFSLNSSWPSNLFNWSIGSLSSE